MTKNIVKTFIITVTNILKHRVGQKLTAREIAEILLKEDQKHLNFMIKNSEVVKDYPTAVTRLVARVNQYRERMPNIKVLEDSPRRFYYSEESAQEELTLIDKPSATNYTEHELYPLLTEYLWSEFNLYPKRIDERKSKNKNGSGGNKWLYPDLVSMEIISTNWEKEIITCAEQHKDKRLKLWSFEVKKRINRANVRECFFQAVSNSTWANKGYLIAAELNSDAKEELRILCDLHGIGFILLNMSSPTESQIIIPAQERSNIDWHTANRICAENKDFKQYIKAIKNYYLTGDLHAADWNIPTE